MSKNVTIEKVNALEIKALTFAEDTEVNESVLKGILGLAKERDTANGAVTTANQKLADEEALHGTTQTLLSTANSDISTLTSYLQEAKDALANNETQSLLDEALEENTRLTEENERLKSGEKGAALPRVTYKKKEYVFNTPKFRLPKQEQTTAVVAAEDESVWAECIKRGVLVLVKKED
jgi:hypothetical protein